MSNIKPCKYLDYTPGKYTDCTIQDLAGFAVPVRFWLRGDTWADRDAEGNAANPLKVQFCGAGRGRINGIFQCYNPGEMSCYTAED